MKSLKIPHKLHAELKIEAINKGVTLQNLAIEKLSQKSKTDRRLGE